MGNVLGGIAAVVLFFTPWTLYGTAGELASPWSILVFLAGIVVMSLSVPLPLWALDRIERHRTDGPARRERQS